MSFVVVTGYGDYFFGRNFLPGGRVAAEPDSEIPIPPHRATWVSGHVNHHVRGRRPRAVYHAVKNGMTTFSKVAARRLEKMANYRYPRIGPSGPSVVRATDLIGAKV